MKIHKETIAGYNELAEKLNKEAAHLAKVSTTYSILRLVVFILAVVLTILLSSIGPIPGILGGLTGIVLFLIVVKKHHQQERYRSILLIKTALVRNELNAITERKNEFYDGSKFIDHQHFYSTDLDVFGPFSLFGLINRCRTFSGNKTLAEYLSVKPSIEEVTYRKTLINNLEFATEWKLSFLSILYEIDQGHDTDIAALVNRILDQDLTFATNSTLALYRKLLPIVWLGITILYFIVAKWAISLAILFGLINLRITLKHAHSVSEIQFRLSKVGLHLQKYATALSMILLKEWPLNLDRKIKEHHDPVSTERKVSSLSALKKLADLLDYRLHMIPSFILNIGFLWDTHIVSKLADWNKKNDFLIDSVFDLIGKVEALVSLSNWSQNHPHYTYASVDESYFQLEGVEMRHPLLEYKECIPNDFRIEQEDRVNIITGSNMSGKSTFLRTLGLNLVLAYAGARVAATKLNVGLVTVFTYMRIKDALEENVSTFKAELNRIEHMLALMSKNEPVFILADEMLRGTNSLDKLKGSRAILIKIIAFKSYAVVATHDIGLTDLGLAYPEVVNNYYFDIDYLDGTLKFDYKIKPGICQNFNASYLLGKLGIDVASNNS